MQTRSHSGIFKHRHIADLAQTPLIHALLASSVPKGFKSVAKHPHWIHAMDEEMAALHSHGTWELIPRPFEMNIVGSKWIF